MISIPSLHQKHSECAGCVLSFADVFSVELKDSNSLEFSLKSEQLLLRSHKAPCIKAMVELFIQELRQVRKQLQSSCQ